MEPDPSRRQKLEAALGKISVPSRLVSHKAALLEILCSLDMTGPGTIPERFRVKSRLGGRPAKVRTQAIAQILGNYYFLVTKKPPFRTIPTEKKNLSRHFDRTPGGQFYDFVAEIFKILGINENADHFTRIACSSFEHPSGRKKRRGVSSIGGASQKKKECMHSTTKGVQHESEKTWISLIYQSVKPSRS